MFVGLSLATIAITGVTNLWVNNRLLTDLAEKGYEVKQDKKHEFSKEVHNLNVLNFIPFVNLIYMIKNNGNKYANRDVHFANLIKKGAIDRLDPDKNDALRATSEKKRKWKVLKWRVKERLGKSEIVTQTDLHPETKARPVRKVACAIKNIICIDKNKTKAQRREDKLRAIVASCDEDTQKMLEALLAKQEEKGKSK